MSSKVPLLACLLLGHAACLGKTCNEVGCLDQASITVRGPGGTTPPLAAQLQIDGRQVTCPAPMVGGVGVACDDRAVHIAHRELGDCTEVRTATAVSQRCVPNGRFEQVITVAGTPQRIVARLMADTTVVGERTFELSYTSVRPNGDGCDPVCRQRAETWELAAP
jgi:hypothetical protein